MQHHKEHRDNIKIIIQHINLTWYQYSSDPNKHNIYNYTKMILIMIGSSQDLNMKHMVEKTTI
jgi:hypothetical protein